MTVRDYINQTPDTPLYLNTCIGPLRVVCASEAYPFPQVTCLMSRGEKRAFWVLSSTELLQHTDDDCPLDIEDCQQCQELYLSWYYAQQMETTDYVDEGML